jgi:hypothetical protein
MGSSTPGLKRHSNRMQRLTSDIADMISARYIVTSKLDQDIRLTREKVEGEAQKFFGLNNRPTMGTVWPCKDSPNGTCWYRANDVRHDECIICYNPEERK